MALNNPASKQLYPIYRYFEYSHLPADQQKVCKLIKELADHMINILPDGPEKAEGLRKLLEAKDCFVRAKVK